MGSLALRPLFENFMNKLSRPVKWLIGIVGVIAGVGLLFHPLGWLFLLVFFCVPRVAKKWMLIGLAGVLLIGAVALLWPSSDPYDGYVSVNPVTLLPEEPIGRSPVLPHVITIAIILFWAVAPFAAVFGLLWFVRKLGKAWRNENEKIQQQPSH